MGISIQDILVFLLFAHWLLQSPAQRSRPSRFYARLTLPALLYLEATLLSLLWAPRLDLAALEVVQMVKVFLLYLVVANQLQDERDVRLCLWALLLALVGQSLIGLLQYIAGSPLSLAFLGEMQAQGESTVSMQRVGGTLGHPNRLSMFLELLLPLTLGLFLTSGRRSARGFALFAFFAGSSAMILTGSRGGWIATAVALALFVAVALKHKRIHSAQVWRLGGLAVIGLTIVGYFFSDQLEHRITGEDHGSAMSRIPMFQIAFSIIEEHPVGGVGINNYAVVMQEYNDTILGRRFSTIPRPVHNMYLLIAGETGAIGLVTFALFLIALLRLLWQTVLAHSPDISIYALALLSGILAFLVHGLVDKHPPGGYPPFYLLMALAVVLPELIFTRKLDKA